MTRSQSRFKKSAEIAPNERMFMNEIRLAEGAHDTREAGMCAMEFVAWVANEPHTDRPKCVDTKVAAVFIGLNDSLDDDRRQLLKPYLGRCIGTAGDGHEDERHAVGKALPGACAAKTCLACGFEILATKSDAEIIAALEALLPTEELPWVTEAIAEKVAVSA